MIDNIIVLSADRNGSTAYMENLKKTSKYTLNGDYEVFLSECFSQDEGKNQPPHWWDPVNFPPDEVVRAINFGTGKRVVLKLQITWPTFDSTYYKINASRKIFLHRNLFDSTLSRCVALKTGHWFTDLNSEQNTGLVHIDADFFKSRLDYRIERYIQNLDYILTWCNEWIRYENYNYQNDLRIKPNIDKQLVVENYNELYDLFQSRAEIKVIEKEISKKINDK